MPSSLQRISTQSGQTLSEMIVVLVILLIVVAALARVFASAQTSENRVNTGTQAQTQARLALDSLRRELRCASSITSSDGTWPTSASAITIQLGSYCPTNTTGATATVTWCTLLPVGGSTYTLWRDSGATCDTSGRPLASGITTTSAVPSGRVFGPFTASVPNVARAAQATLFVETTATDGHLVAGTYAYVTTFTVQTIALPTVTWESAGTETTVTVPAGSSTNKIDVICPPYVPPAGYKVLGCNIYGRASGAEKLLVAAATLGPSVNQWIDDGSTALGATAPATSAGATLVVHLPIKPLRSTTGPFELVDSLALQNVAR